MSHRLTRLRACWDTNPDYGNNAELRKRIDARRIYLRLFNVAWDQQNQKPYPAGSYQGSWIWGDSIEPVPVVFITNETLLKLDSAGVLQLARHIVNKAEAYYTG